MNRSEEDKKRLIKKSDERGEFIQDVDGFVYWIPERSTAGQYSSHHLRWIADELDRRNSAWQRKIDKFFENKPLEDDDDDEDDYF